MNRLCLSFTLLLSGSLVAMQQSLQKDARTELVASEVDDEYQLIKKIAEQSAEMQETEIQTCASETVAPSVPATGGMSQQVITKKTEPAAQQVPKNTKGLEHTGHQQVLHASRHTRALQVGSQMAISFGFLYSLWLFQEWWLSGCSRSAN